MKTALTLMIEESLVAAARAAAARRGVSLSAVVEEFFAETVTQQAPPFGDRWRGAFEAAEGDTTRLKALRRKYH